MILLWFRSEPYGSVSNKMYGYWCSHITNSTTSTHTYTLISFMYGKLSILKKINYNINITRKDLVISRHPCRKQYHYIYTRFGTRCPHQKILQKLLSGEVTN